MTDVVVFSVLVVALVTLLSWKFATIRREDAEAQKLIEAAVCHWCGRSLLDCQERLCVDRRKARRLAKVGRKWLSDRT